MTTPTPSIALLALVAKQMSLDIKAPAYAQIPDPLQINMEINVTGGPHGDEMQRCEVMVRLTASRGKIPAYTASAVFEAVGKMEGFTAEQIEEMRDSILGTQAFPYVRQALSNMVSHAGYPAPMLPLMQIPPKSMQKAMAEPANEASIH